jgi:hypothetical protein
MGLGHYGRLHLLHCEFSVEAQTARIHHKHHSTFHPNPKEAEHSLVHSDTYNIVHGTSKLDWTQHHLILFSQFRSIDNMKRVLGPKPDDHETQSDPPASTPSPAVEKTVIERKKPRQEQTLPPEVVEILMPSLKVGAVAGMVLESVPSYIFVCCSSPNICQAPVVFLRERPPASFGLPQQSSSQPLQGYNGLPWVLATMVSSLYLKEKKVSNTDRLQRPDWLA